MNTIRVKSKNNKSIEVTVAWKNRYFAIHHRLKVITLDDEVIEYLDAAEWTLSYIRLGVGIWHSTNINDLVTLGSIKELPSCLKNIRVVNDQIDWSNFDGQKIIDLIRSVLEPKV